MKRLTARDHLIVARDHGLHDVPVLYAVDDRTDRFHVHVDCPAATTPSAYEDLPDHFLISSCEDCRNGHAAARHNHLIGDVDRLISTASIALDLTGLYDYLYENGRLRALKFELPEDEEAILTQYVATGYFLRRTAFNAGRSAAEQDAHRDVDAPNGVRAHVADLTEDLTRFWHHRLHAQAPIGTHLAGGTTGERRVRVVPNRQRQRGFDATRQDPRDAALQLEAHLLLATQNWELIEWNTNLNEWATTEQPGATPDHAIAEAEGLNFLQLEQVLRLFTREPWMAGPTLQELVDAVRAASS